MSDLPDKPLKLLDALAIICPGVSRSELKRRIVHGRVTLNGMACKQPHAPVTASDKVLFQGGKSKSYPKSRSPFRILFEDEHILAVDKPAGILTYGEKGTGGTSVYRELTDFLRKRKGSRETVFVVHRLDREVSGVLMFSKSESLQQKFKENWRSVSKRYLALVEGEVKKKEGTIRSYLTEDDHFRVHSTGERESARLAVTRYKVLKVTENYTLLEIEPETGRKNQIRVHLSEMGHPVVGDYRYGADSKVKRRVRLHAFLIQFEHPLTGREIRIISREPTDFRTPGLQDEKYK